MSGVSGDGDSTDVLLADLAARASAGCEGVRTEWLHDYLTAVTTLLRSGGELDEVERARCRATGGLAATAGVALPSVVDSFLSATRLLWDEVATLFATETAPMSVDHVLKLGQRAFRAADDALAAVADGYARAGRAVVRQEEGLRRQFIEDVLGGGADVADMVVRSERYGLHLTAPHAVAVIATSSPLHSEEVSVATLEDQLRTRLPGRDLLVTVKDARVVAIIGSHRTTGADSLAPRDLGGVLVEVAETVLGGNGSSRVVLGGEHEGPSGIGMSYREAQDALSLATDLDWPHRVVATEEMAVYRVLLRDSHALSGLVRSVLSPLTTARGGADPLIETLTTFLASGAVVTETARRLHLSPRAVTYRLDRIHALTGRDPTNPDEWLTLHIAAVGSRLLGWPTRADQAAQ